MVHSLNHDTQEEPALPDRELRHQDETRIIASWISEIAIPAPQRTATLGIAKLRMTSVEIRMKSFQTLSIFLADPSVRWLATAIVITV